MVCGKVIKWIADILVTACAIAIVCITALNLDGWSWNPNDYTTNGVTDPSLSETSCLLGKSDTSTSLCTGTYIVVGLSLLASMILGALQCMTCNCLGTGKICDTLLAAAMLCMWAIAAVIVTIGAIDYNDDDPAKPEESSRNWVVALYWVEVALLTLSVILGLASCCK